MKRKRIHAFSTVFIIAALFFTGLSVKDGIPYLKEEEVQRRNRARFIMELADEESLLSLHIDFAGLKKMNPDIIGWIYIPGTKVDEPILQRQGDNTYYLQHSEQGEPSSLGAVYLYDSFSPEFLDRHVILFGHNLRSGQKFGMLSRFASESYALKYPNLYVYLPEVSMKWRIASAYICTIDDDTYRFADSETALRELADHMQSLSVWDSIVPNRQVKQILTLSTCANGNDSSKRFVVNYVIEEVKRAGQQARESEDME